MKPQDMIDAFHNHLDVCARCREQPFNLCSVGAPLLKKAGDAILGSSASPSIPKKGA